MPKIEDLTILQSINEDDLLVFYSKSNGDSYTISLSNLASIIQNLITVDDGKLSQYSSPSASGFSIQINDDDLSVHLILTPVAGYASGTLVFPTLANCVDKQEILVNCTQAITTLTINGNGATVTGAPTTLSANSFFRMKYDIINSTWYRIG